MSELYQRIYEVVKLIPKGRVMSYGGVARQAGIPRAPRLAGYALFALPEGSRVPWWRVVNAQGRISNASRPDAPDIQRVLLRAEGVAVDEDYRLAMRDYDAEDLVHDRLAAKRARRRAP